MADNMDYIKVNELITDRKSSENADVLTQRIINSDYSKIVVDWEESGVMDLAFVDRYLNALRGFCGSNKKIINKNLSKSALAFIKPIIVDKSEIGIFDHIYNSDN